jgi:hypothetical protein
MRSIGSLGPVTGMQNTRSHHGMRPSLADKSLISATVAGSFPRMHASHPDSAATWWTAEDDLLRKRIVWRDVRQFMLFKLLSASGLDVHRAVVLVIARCECVDGSVDGIIS